MKNRITVRRGMLADLRTYLVNSGWKLEEPKGEYEVLRARKPGYPRPLLVHARDFDKNGGCGYSIDERDTKIYNGWIRNRKKRGIAPYWATEQEKASGNE